jgi:Uroporphyrinogen-III synthase
MAPQPQRRILITRPAPEAAALQQRLAQMGLAADCAPMLSICIHRNIDLPLNGVRALLFTSANGVRAFAANAERRDFAVFAVGEASAQAARSVGFQQVTPAGGDVESLASLVRREWKPQDGPLLHAAGTVLAGDLQKMLQTDGYDVRRATLYEAVTAESLPQDVAERFAAGGYDAAMFFSPRTAATFVSLSQTAGIAGGAAFADALCLSRNVAAAVAPLPWRSTRIAAQPREDDLIDLVGQPDAP